MTSTRRYAVYWAPPRGSALARFGAAWLGRDAETGGPVPHPEVSGLPLPVAEITAAPRRYGFHATLKPPFRLAEGTEFAELDHAAMALAAGIAPVEAPALTPARIGSFIALVPSAPCPALASLAGRCVTALDCFRAPPGAAELARRRAAGLTPGQEALLARWGYPYVRDEYRFHLTLTGALEPAVANAALEVLTDLTASFCVEPMAVAEICLFAESRTGEFHILRRYALTG